MPSSRDTTKTPTANELYAALSRKMKSSSDKIMKRKIEAGEYVDYNGKILPSNMIEDYFSPTPTALMLPPRSGSKLKVWRQQTALILKDDKAPRFLIRGRGMASSVKALTPPPISKSSTLGTVKLLPVRLGLSQTEPNDGQLFIYNAKTGELNPVKKSAGTIARTTRQNPVAGTTFTKVK